MTTYANKYTIRDAMLGTDAKGEFLDVADVISKATGIMDILEFHPTNQAYDHLTARRTDQGTPTTRVANEGAQEIKGSKDQVIDIPVHYNNVIKPDPLFLKKFNSPEEWKADEVRAIAQGYAEAYTEQLITGVSTSDPGRSIDGLATRLGSLPSDVNDVTDPKHTVRSAGGSGSDNSSIYIVGIGKQGAYGLYHKNGQAGFQMKQLPEQLITLGSGDIVCRPIDLSWDVGFSATNYRTIGRLCNIDYSDLTDDASSGANLMNLLTRLINSTKVMTMGLKPVLLANEALITYFENQRRNFGGNAVKTNVDLGLATNYTTFKGIPFVQTDAIGVAEATIS
jgi:hypothetical protein